MERIKLPNGKEVPAKREGFLSSGGEHWNEYRLDDGVIIRVKTVVQKIYRVYKDDEKTPEVTSEGDPHVLVRSVTHVVAENP